MPRFDDGIFARVERRRSAATRRAAQATPRVDAASVPVTPFVPTAAGRISLVRLQPGRRPNLWFATFAEVRLLAFLHDSGELEISALPRDQNRKRDQLTRA